MISYALDTTSRSGLFDKIHVSTDSMQIRNVVEELGFQVDFMRPAESAQDDSGLIPVLQYVLETYQARGERFEDLCTLLPCSPLIEPDDLLAGYDQYAAGKGKRPLHVVSPLPVPIEWAYRRAPDGVLTPVNPGAFARRSQDLPTAFYECGPFSWFHRDHLLGSAPVGDQGFTSIELPRHKAVDMDTPADVVFAEIIYTGISARSGTT